MEREWIILGVLAAGFLGTIVALMLIMFLFPITRWIVLGLALITIASILYSFGETEVRLGLGIGLGTIAIATMLFPLLVWYVLAPSNRFFTFVKEGTVKIVVRGDKFEKALMQWSGYALDKEWNIVPENEWVKDGKVVSEGTPGARKYKEPWHPFGGLRFYGLYPLMDIYIYTFTWTGVAEDGEIDPHPKEPLSYILAEDDVYWFELVRAEDINLLPLRIEVLLTIRVLNPFKALFRIQNWLETIINRTRPLVRDAMTTDSYENLIKQQERLGVAIMKKLTKLTTGRKGTLEAEFEDRYGVEVRKIDVKEIDPPPEYREITLKKYIAERQREEIVTLAGAEAERMETVYRQIQEFGDTGRLVRTLEAAEKSPFAASLTVQAIPGLQEILRGVFGRPPEAVTREEYRELREMIEGLAARIPAQK